MSWQASKPSGPAESTPPSWAAGQGSTVVPKPKAEETSKPIAAASDASKPAPAEEKNKEKVVSKPSASTGPSQALLFLAMMVEGVAFGSLLGRAVLRGEGVKFDQTKKYLGLASIIGPLLVLDSKDCCRYRLGDLDVALLALHLVLSLKSLFERSMNAAGPWSFGKIPADNVMAAVAFFAHLRCFLHLLTKEAKGSLAKKLTLLASFALGSNLTVM